MNEIIRKDLEKMMDSILNTKEKKQDLISAERAYIKYLSESEELAYTIRRLALEDKINESLLQDIFIMFIFPQFLIPYKYEEYPQIPPSEEKIEFPPFWNERIENKFKLYKYFKTIPKNTTEENSLGIALWGYRAISNLKIRDKKILTKTYEHIKKNLKALKNIHNDLINEFGFNKNQESKNNKPFVYIKNGKGYLKFDNRSAGIIIGGKKTRQVKLLQTLTEPHFGVHKNIETIFEAIRLPKDSMNERLNNSALRRGEILNKIAWTKKEIQKKFNRKLTFHSANNENTFWIDWEG